MDKICRQTLYEDIRSVLLEVLYGKPIVLDIGGKHIVGLVSKNVRPGELPYRITLFDGSSREDLTPTSHVQLSEKEANLVITQSELPELVKKVLRRDYGSEPKILNKKVPASLV